MLFQKYLLAVLLTGLAFLSHAQDEFHTAKIDGKIYQGHLDSNAFYLRDGRGRLLLKVTNKYYFSFSFKDFNADGYKDLLIEYSGNTPGVLDLFIFTPRTHTFRKIQDFNKFPAPQRIKGAHYFYSYHHSGCADMNWDSDLFYIHDTMAIALGNIAGRECGDSDEKDGIYIHRIHKGKRSLITTLPIQRIQRYKYDKWGFIDAWWKKHYKQFII
jgi:hypothetical protein